MEISNLPNEVLQHVFGFLNHNNRLKVREVCRAWRELASTTQFTDRIWLRLAFEQRNLLPQMTVFKDSIQNYRHVVIDFHYFHRYFINHNIYGPWISQLVKLFTAVNNVETLVLFGMHGATATEFLILLQNFPKLRRLYLLGTDFLQRYFLNQACFSDYPNLKYLRMMYYDKWLEILANNSTTVLEHVNDVMLTTPMEFKIKIESFQRMFPNLNQLQVTVNDQSIVELIGAYKDQLTKLSMCSICVHVSTLFKNTNFPKLTHLYLRFRYPTNEVDITDFLENPCHARNLLELKLPNMNASIFPTICSSCTFLRVLDVSATSIDLLENVSNLRNLQKLTIRHSKESQRTQSVENFQNYCQPIQSLKEVTIIELFDSITTVLPFIFISAPNLEMFSLLHVGKAEEIFPILSERNPNIQHLSLCFTWSHPEKPPQRNLGYLKNMTKLASYSLTSIAVDQDGIQKWIQMAPNLSNVTISGCETLTDEQLMALGSCCPKLKKVHLHSCAQVTAQGLKGFQQNFPHVTITNAKGKTLEPYLDDDVAYIN